MEGGGGVSRRKSHTLHKFETWVVDNQSNLDKYEILQVLL